MKRSNGLTQKKGFTLVEVLTVVAMIAVISAIVLSSLSNQRRIRMLDLSAQEVTAALRTAQEYALQGRNDSVSDDVCAYRVRMSGADYSIIEVSRTGNNCNRQDNLITYDLRGTIRFGGSDTVTFSTPRGESSGGTTVQLRLGTFNRYVCVTANGRVFNNGDSSNCP